MRIIVGQRFGRWTVIRQAESRNRQARWLCQCDCGTERTVGAQSLTEGRSVSCGCYHKQVISKLFLVHGGAKPGRISPLYSVWGAMKQRCFNPLCKAYPNYGGRGITVCERWASSYANFLSDMGEPPTPKHSIDRINNDGNYEPENCRWATQKEQSRNSRNNRHVTIDGTTKVITDWSANSGVSRETILSRLGKGWSASNAVFCKPLWVIKRSERRVKSK